MQQPDTVFLQKSVTFSIVAVMILIVAVVIGATVIIGQNRHELMVQEYAVQAHKSIDHVITHYLKNYTYRLRGMTETPILAEMLKKRDREGLYRLLKPTWDLLREEEPNVAILHIHLSDGTSFLRMHKPERFGDELMHLRPMIKEVHHDHRKLGGFETGRFPTAYRIMVPIFDGEGIYLGAIEIGLKPGFMLRSIFDINGFYSMTFVKEDEMQLSRGPGDVIIDGYRLHTEPAPVLEAVLGELKSVNRLENGIEISVGDRRYFTHLYVLRDFKGREKVKLLFFQDISGAEILGGNLPAIASVLLLGAFVFLAWFVFRRISTYAQETAGVYDEQLKRLDESENRFRLLYEHAPMLTSRLTAAEP